MILQCKNKPCLRLHRTSAGGSKIFFFHHLPLTVCDFLILLSRFFLFKHLCCFCNNLCTRRIVDVCNIRFISRSVHIIRCSTYTIKSQPVPIMENLSPSMMISVNLPDIINPCFHALNLVFEYCFVSAEQIYVPRNNTCGISPHTGAFRRSECGNNLWNHSVRQKLFLIQVI